AWRRPAAAGSSRSPAPAAPRRRLFPPPCAPTRRRALPSLPRSRHVRKDRGSVPAPPSALQPAEQSRGHFGTHLRPTDLHLANPIRRPPHACIPHDRTLTTLHERRQP